MEHSDFVDKLGLMEGSRSVEVWLVEGSSPVEA